MDEQWWRSAVIYQIYPRSFCDSNNDGVGDLQGIVSRLDYLAELGVDGVWISPFFKSPMKDFGYDVSDYRDVAPIFGALDDFDQIIAGAHARGLKVLIDLVVSHTSDAHPWFADSRERGDKEDWYVWADAKPDGSPPNNWLSIFGGSAWQWEARRGQYYLHNFLASQPDLNFHNEKVVEAVLEVAKFWLDRGVDGFRLDTANFYTHDPLLRDNPPKTERVVTDGVALSNPYSFQQHVHDKSRPENFAFLKKLRALTDRYPGRFTIGEIGADDSISIAASYVRGNLHLHTAYTFDLLGPELSPALIKETVSRMLAESEDGCPCWSFGNHDSPRVVTRWATEELTEASRQAFAKMLGALLLTLPGALCIYQGEELGLPEAQIPFEMLQDPYGNTFWPQYKGRDGCRTPIPWRDERVESWLPIPETHRALNVAAQETEPGSVLNAYRSFLRFRKQHRALLSSSARFLELPEPLLGIVRSTEKTQILAVFNLSFQPQSVDLKGFPKARRLEEAGTEKGPHDRLEAAGYAFWEL